MKFCLYLLFIALRTGVRRLLMCLLLVWVPLLSGCQKHKLQAAVQPVSTPSKADPVRDAISLLAAKPTSIEGYARRVEAVKIVGESRSIAAIPILIDHLMEISPFSSDNYFCDEETFPAYLALAQIGEPAVPAIEERFEKAASPREQSLLLKTLLRIKGKKWGLAYLDRMGKAGALSGAERDDLRSYVNSITLK